jgi:hypothetical protein
MTKAYKLEMNIILTDEEQANLMESARRLYDAISPTVQYDDQKARELTAEEAIDGPASALMHIVGENSVFNELDVYPEKVSCIESDDDEPNHDSLDEASEDETEALTATAESSSDEDDLDDWNDDLYLCRWPNGDFSVVKAESKRNALVQLDEWAGALASWLIPLDTFMADFRLDDLGGMELKEFGEETKDFIRSRCYPALEAVVATLAATAEKVEYSTEEEEQIKKAVKYERTRLWNNQLEGPPAKTELGKRLQASMGTTGPVADHYVEMAAKHLLESDAGEDGKPN